MFFTKEHHSGNTITEWPQRSVSAESTAESWKLFLQIYAGVVALQLSRSAKGIPDAAVLKGYLDQMQEVTEQEIPETEPRQTPFQVARPSFGASQFQDRRLT